MSVGNHHIGKIKIVRNTFQRFQRQIEQFSKLDSSLKDSEMYLNLMIKTLQDDFTKASTLNDEIISHFEDGEEAFDRYIADNIYNRIQLLYFKHAATLHGYLKIVVSADNHNLNVTHSEFTSSTFNRLNLNQPTGFNQNESLNSTSFLNLNIIEFDGDYEKWPDFRDGIESSVNSNATYNNATKLKILQHYLKGDALKVIKRDRSKLLPENYLGIWELLKKRYNHKRTLVNAYFGMLFYQDCVENETSSGLKKLYDTTYDALSSLSSMELQVSNWGDILLFLVHSKLPIRTKELWDEYLGKSEELPTFEDFMDFIETRFRTLEGVEATRQFSNFNSHSIQKPNNSRRTALHTVTKSSSKTAKKEVAQKSNNQKPVCKCCDESSHALHFCKVFKNMSPSERIEFINTHDQCYNCLSNFHSTESCESEYRCGFCGFKHHTMLHVDSKLTKEPKQYTKESDDGFQERSSGTTKKTLVSSSEENAIFPTAVVRVLTRNGAKALVRALVDACSDVSYISEQTVQRLQLSKKPTFIETSGLSNSTTGVSNYFVVLEIQSTYNDSSSLHVRAYVIPEICNRIPIHKFDSKNVTPNKIHLADPHFNVPAKIDMLLGGIVDAKITLSKNIKSNCGTIIFKETSFGYMANGLIPNKRCLSTLVNYDTTKDQLRKLDQTLRSFWEIEEVQTTRCLTKEEILAEEEYSQTTRRLECGRYMVSLPFKNRVDHFINMRKIAFSRFSHLERKLSRDTYLNEQYSKCLEEYIEMGHMVEVDPNEYPNGYYLPHHCVLKETSSTTKLRVVFDASARDSNLMSLNENLLTGPRLQADLLDLLLKFRTFKFAVTADIEKMYRQILVDPKDRKFQLLLWRSSSTEEVKTYAMNRVTFGTTPAPFLAVRTLFQLANDERDQFPIGSKCLKSGFYVDDFIYGADTLDEAVEIQKQTISILNTAGLHLRKWSANHNSLLDHIPESDRETKSLLTFEDELAVKTLGIKWSPVEDRFHFEYRVPTHQVHTKRSALSDIAKIFDPLGWISPCVILAKILIQDIWLAKIEWDDPLPSQILDRWVELRDQLEDISDISIPRWIETKKSQCKIELHGFSDASEVAYAACIYITVRKHGQVTTNLLIAKTKVSPIQRLSIPRLELCAANLLAKLVNHVLNVLDIPEMTTHCWSDSTITLAWIKDSPHKRSTYVANRVADIQSLTGSSCWRHVHTKDNPADLGSRGVFPADLKSNLVWWKGPAFLENFDSESTVVLQVDCQELPSEEDKKEKPAKAVAAAKQFHNLCSLRKTNLLEVSLNFKQFQVFENETLNKFSTLSKLCRVVAYCKRVKRENRKPHTFITPAEYELALISIIKLAQKDVFWEELSLLENHKSITKQSKIYSVNPFINKDDGLLRVNGRLTNAKHLSYDQRCPIILPYNHVLSELIVRHSHVFTLHGTIQETMMHVCGRFHIVRCKTLVKAVCNRCVICFRFRSSTLQQQMGQLPIDRVNPERPFANCGVDFAGPFELKKWRGRCNKFHKSYFAIFICFATKAVHLEVVIDLSTAAFVACYRRFIARRGIAKKMYSDCGTNFVGSEKIITRSMMECAEKWNLEIAQELSILQTEWHFNPPSAPHFGGLWEAGVKSVKHHIKRIMGNAKLTYDEFETILLQIESCLNSRPITKLSADPNSIVLTPGHFLIGGPLNALPSSNIVNDKIVPADRWNYLQQLFQQIWKVWSGDYLNILREREKWKDGKENIEINDVVLVKDNNIPPNAWLKGKVTDIHPDPEGFVRVATIKTQNSVFKRPIVKLAPLPIYKHPTDYSNNTLN